MLLSYSATKGAILAFTRSLAAQLVEKDVRVNAVAPGRAPAGRGAAAARLAGRRRGSAQKTGALCFISLLNPALLHRPSSPSLPRPPPQAGVDAPGGGHVRAARHPAVRQDVPHEPRGAPLGGARARLRRSPRRPPSPAGAWRPTAHDLAHAPPHPPQIAPSYVFLASEDASFFTGTTLHPNGGTPVNS